MKKEKGKKKKERGKGPPVAEWLRAIEKIKNYELRIIRRLACIPLTLTPLTLSPAIDLHRGMKKEKRKRIWRKAAGTSIRPDKSGLLGNRLLSTGPQTAKLKEPPFEGGYGG